MHRSAQSLGMSCRCSLHSSHRVCKSASCTAIYSAAQCTANGKSKPGPNKPQSEAAGCQQLPCNELNGKSREPQPWMRCERAWVGSHLPAPLFPCPSSAFGLHHNFILSESTQERPAFSRGQLKIHQIRGVKPKPILTLTSKGNFFYFLIFKADVAFML